MYKRILAGLLAVTIVFGSGTVLPANILVDCGGIEVSAEDLFFQDFRYMVNDGSRVEILGYKGTDSIVSVPSEIDGKKVTMIGDYAFSECEFITDITIPEGVLSIGRGSFSDCTSLTSVTLPNSITGFGYGAFFGCKSLTNITIPDRVVAIGENAFYGCESLTSITIPKSIERIGESAFGECTGLTSVTFPDNDNNISIGNGAFGYCTSLSDLTLSDSVTWIGYLAFAYCESLKSVIIPDSVVKIEDDSFGYGANDFKIYCYPQTYVGKNYAINNGFDYEIIGGYDYVELDDGTIEIIDYTGDEDVLNVPAVIDEKKVTSIGLSAFRGCTELTNVTLPDGVTSIGDCAFDGCTALTNITLPDSLTSVKGDAFYNCNSLTSIIIPNSVTSIGSNAFNNCCSLTSITISNSVTSIEYGAFGGCESLTEITIPNGVTDIGDYAFNWCIGLKNITIPDSVTNIGQQAFYGSKNLVSITIPKSVTSIGDRAIGYYYDEHNDDYSKIDNFKIYCYSDTEGEQYAIDNGFDYELLDKPAVNGMGTVEIKNNISGSETENILIEIGREGYDETVMIVEVGSDGGFIVEGLEDGVYYFTFRAGGCAPRTYSVTVKDGTFDLDNVELYLYGDVNGDGEINGKDIIRLRKYLAAYDESTGNSDAEVLSGADTNGDGTVNGKDLIRLRKYLAEYDEETGQSPVTLGK